MTVFRRPRTSASCRATGQRLGPDAVADGVADAGRERRLELGGGLRQGLDLRPRPLERGVDVTLPGAALSGVRQPLHRPLDRFRIHLVDATTSVGRFAA